jgi:hypothetical protein
MSPTALLYSILGLMIATSIFTGLIFVELHRRYKLEAAKYGEAIPLFKYLLSEFSAHLMHPHPWAAEADELMREANQEPLKRMSDERYARLKGLLVEIATGTEHEEDMKPFEREYAASYLLAMAFARREKLNPDALSSFRLVVAQPPPEQTLKEKDASRT